MKTRLLIVLLALPVWLSATQIHWFCPPGLLNENSDGTVLDDSYRFELGAFENGFTPSVENMEEWADHWVPVQRAIYDVVNQWFTGVYNVTADSPIAQGDVMYIWGFSGDPENGEWILCGHNGWRWPKPNIKRPVPTVWKMTEAKVVVLGEVSKNGVSLKTAVVNNVTPPKTSWKQWARENLGHPNSDPNGDANGNGIIDILEFVAGLEDLSVEPKGLQIKVTKDLEESVLELLIPRRKDRPANINIEISTDLKQWFDASDLVNLHANKPLELIFRNKTGVTEMGDHVFWRYKVTPQE